MPMDGGDNEIVKKACIDGQWETIIKLNGSKQNRVVAFHRNKIND